MQTLKILGLLLLAIVLAGAAAIVYEVGPRVGPMMQPVIMNFEECAAAGNPVMESYPRQCLTEDGRHFVEDIGVQPPPESITSNGCAVAGCSMQLCVSAEEAPTIVTTCEYRSEYACYAEASCEPQSDGRCGWTATPELQSCLANPPQEDLEVM